MRLRRPATRSSGSEATWAAEVNSTSAIQSQLVASATLAESLDMFAVVIAGMAVLFIRSAWRVPAFEKLDVVYGIELGYLCRCRLVLRFQLRFQFRHVVQSQPIREVNVGPVVSQRFAQQFAELRRLLQPLAVVARISSTGP